MAAPKTQVPETRSPPHDQSTAPAPDRGKRCCCGILPDRKAALEHRANEATGKRTTAPAPDRGKRCRCGILPDRKAALGHREDGEAGERTAAPAPDRGKRCRCGILPDRKAALEHREDGAAEKRTTAPAPDRGKRCRCGGGRMVVWARMENLPRSGLSKGSNSLTSRFMVCLFMLRNHIRRYMTVTSVTVSQLQYVCVFHE